MSDMLLTVLMLSLSGSILALLLFILKPLLKNRASKAFSYYIWILVLFRLVFSLGYVVNISDFVLWSSSEFEGVAFGRNSEQLLSSNTKATGMGDVFASANKLNGVDNNGLNNNGLDNSGLNNNVLGKGTLDNNTLDNSTLKNNIPVNEAKFFPIIGVLINHGLLIWLVGVVASVCWYFLVYAIFCHRIYKFATVPHKKDMIVFEEMRGKNKNVRLICSSYIATPMLMGIFKPVVVLPQFAYMANGMEIEFRNILRHELVHHRRHDTVYKWFTILVNSLHWFNPLIYLVVKEISRAGELSCDEAVIRDMTATQRQSYGNTLLALTTSKRLPKGVTGTTMCEEKQQLKGRLINIKKYKKKSKWAIALMMVVALMLTGCASIYGSLERDNEENSTEIENLDKSKTVPQNTENSEPTIDNLKDDNIENASSDMNMFKNIFLPLAKGEIENDWESFQQVLSQAGYSFIEDEGTYSVMDNQYPSSYLGGDLTTRNGFAEVYSLKYHFNHDGVRRTVMVEFNEDAINYYIGVTMLQSGTEVQSIEEIIQFIENGSGESESTISLNNTAMNSYKEILQGSSEFFCTNANTNLDINKLDQAIDVNSSVSVKASNFVVLDLDSDGISELILGLSLDNNDDYGYEILHYREGVVYGYTLWYREFTNFKVDGTFSFSGGVADSGFGTMEFAENSFFINQTTYSQSSYDSHNNMSISYYVNSKNVTEDEFLAAVNRQEEKPDATWYDVTDDNIKHIFQ